MKWLPAVCVMLFSLSALADGASKPIALHQAPANIEVINGKRFYSLSNVRRFTGDTNNPKAQSVMHAPRPDGVVTGRRTLPLMPASASAAATANAPATPQAQKDQLLSIFTPDEKAAPAASQPPATK